MEEKKKKRRNKMSVAAAALVSIRQAECNRCIHKDKCKDKNGIRLGACKDLKEK